ncbi:MAG TPA: MBL fold metallo-hydrolase [Phycisphaerae bacterium]|jgi:ribonuclease Z|nr:MBL fold metallo-hydrolase [Phycisphaerae bacterium]HRS27449.1 MBL fold metallo-hydrolase [Phycisphaerae bacterium]
MPSALAEIAVGGFHVGGFSTAGEETFFVIPEMNLGFDIGRGRREVLAVDNIFLSHGHMDHAAGVAYYFSQRMFIDNRPGNLYAPEPLVQPIRRLLQVWGEIDGNEPPANIFPAYPGVDIQVRRDLIVRPFEVNHPCRRRVRGAYPSLGYVAIEVRNKLLDEYQGLEGPELVALKKKGVAITRRVELPLVAYCGDTAPGDFFKLDYVRDAKILLLECTFVDPDHLERARAGFHIHVSDLREILPQLRNERIVLCHLSRRTALPEAREIIARELGDLFSDRVSLLMQHRARPRRRPPDPGPAGK